MTLLNINFNELAKILKLMGNKILEIPVALFGAFLVFSAFYVSSDSPSDFVPTIKIVLYLITLNGICIWGSEYCHNFLVKYNFSSLLTFASFSLFMSLLIVISGLYLGPITLYIMLIFCAFLYYKVCSTSIVYEKKTKPNFYASILSILTLFAVFLVFSTIGIRFGWFGGYTNPWFDTFITGGREYFVNRVYNRDTVSHIAYATMYDRFGIFSSGMEGTIKLNYHLASHVWMVSVARITNATISQCYNWAFMPLLYSWLIGSMYQFLRINSRNFPAYLHASILLIILVTPWQTGRFLNSNSDLIISESYGYSMLLSLFFIYAQLEHKFNSKTKLIKYPDYIISLILFPTALTWICFSKLSTGLLLLIFTFLVAFIKIASEFSWIYVGEILLSTLGLGWLQTSNKSTRTFYLEDFSFQTMVNWSNFDYYFKNNLHAIIYGICFIIFALVKKQLFSNSATRKTFVFCLFLFVCFCVTDQTNHINVDGGSSAYFLCLTAAFSWLLLPNLILELYKSIPLKSVSFFMLFIMVIWSSYSFIGSSLINESLIFYESYSDAKNELKAHPDEITKKFSQFINALREIRKAPFIPSAVYIPFQESGYWHPYKESNHVDYDCERLPMTITSESGYPTIFAIDQRKLCFNGRTYNAMQFYFGDKIPFQTDIHISDEILCKKAKSYNLYQVYILISSKESNEVSIKILKCDP